MLTAIPLHAHDYRVMKKFLLLAPYNKIYSPDKIVLNLTKTNTVYVVSSGTKVLKCLGHHTTASRVLLLDEIVRCH
jgi:hypothetical protein